MVKFLDCIKEQLKISFLSESEWYFILNRKHEHMHCTQSEFVLQ